MKKALFFSIDALIGAMILIGGLIAASQYHVGTELTTNLNYVSEDLVSVLGEVSISEINNTYVATLIANNNITRLNNTILEQIGEFWANGESELAINLTREILAGFSGNYGYGLFIDGKEVWSNNISSSRTLVSSFKLISGIAENKSSNGYVARASALGLSGNSTDIFVFNPEGSGYGAGASKKAKITKKVYLNYTNMSAAMLYLSVHTGVSGMGNQNKLSVNGNNIDTGSGITWTYLDQLAYNSNTKISFGNVSVKNYLVNGWNNITLDLFGQNDMHTHLHPGGRLEVTYLKNKEYIPYDNVVKRIYFDEITGWGGAWAIMPIEVPQDVNIKDATFSIKASNIDNKPPGQIPASNKYNVQIYINDQTVALDNPDANGNYQKVFNLTSKLHEGTNVLSVYMNCYGDVNWGDSDEKYIESSPEYNIAYLLKENFMESELTKLGATIYHKSSNSETNAFLNSLSNYPLVVIEDGHLSSSQMSSVESYVSDGGIAFISEHALSDTGLMFGKTYTKRSGLGLSAIVERYDDALGLTIDQALNPDEDPTISGSGITKIANFSDGTIMIGNWTYGLGKVYYFSDFDESILSAAYRSKVANAITYFVPVSNSTFIEIKYDDTNRKRMQWGKLSLSKSEKIGGNKSVSKLFVRNISEDYTLLNSYFALATLDFNNTYIRVNDVLEFYNPRYYATPTNIFLDPSAYIEGNNTFNISGSCPVCYILPETAFYYSILIPASVGYGNTFPTLLSAKADAKQRLIDLLGEYASYTSIQENNSMILSNVPTMWGPALVELRVWH